MWNRLSGFIGGEGAEDDQVMLCLYVEVGTYNCMQDYETIYISMAYTQKFFHVYFQTASATATGDIAMEEEMTVDDLKSQTKEQQKLILQLKEMIREREQSLAEKAKENKVRSRHIDNCNTVVC